jgi:hypothetical protein
MYRYGCMCVSVPVRRLRPLGTGRGTLYCIPPCESWRSLPRLLGKRMTIAIPRQANCERSFGQRTQYRQSHPGIFDSCNARNVGVTSETCRRCGARRNDGAACVPTSSILPGKTSPHLQRLHPWRQAAGGDPSLPTSSNSGGVASHKHPACCLEVARYAMERSCGAARLPSGASAPLPRLCLAQGSQIEDGADQGSACVAPEPDDPAHRQQECSLLHGAGCEAETSLVAAHDSQGTKDVQAPEHAQGTHQAGHMACRRPHRHS